MLRPFFAVTLACLAATDLRAQDSNPSPRGLGGAARADRGLVPTQPSGSRTARTLLRRVHDAGLVDAGLVPGAVRGGGGTLDTASVIYDNGSTDGSNGYTNGTVAVLGARRTLLDDFALGTTATLGGMEWTHLWQTASPPFGSGAEMDLRLDAGGAPGAVAQSASVTTYTETATGNVYFDRVEALSCITILPITLDAGTYWHESTIVGPDNDYWLVRATVTGSECWTNYDDLGGLRPGSDTFGVEADLNFQLTTGCDAPACGDCVGALVDNGPTDGSNGYSNATIQVLGARRTLLDDFVLASDAGVDTLRWTHVWDGGAPPPFGTSAELAFRSDAGGAPGQVLTQANVTAYCEGPSGFVFFSRPEAESAVSFVPVSLLGGVPYWFEGTVVGADNDFWMVRSTVTGAECWTNYDDFGGLHPGSALFGVAADLNFCLRGSPTVADCLIDNGETDASNGYSNATAQVFGARRTLLDDFSSPDPFESTGITWTHVWAQGQAAPFGTGAEFLYRTDAGGTPGSVLTVANVTDYTEIATGNVYFSRPEARSTATHDSVPFPGNTAFWFEGTVVGADDNFWLIRATITGTECWVNYEDSGGLSAGSDFYSFPADLNFCLRGSFERFTLFCDPSDGSSNNTASIHASSASLASGVTIGLAGGPPTQFTYLLIGDGNTVIHQPPGSKGDLCVTGGTCLGRYAQDIGRITASGTFTTDIEHSASGGPGYGIPTCGGHITVGQTWSFQYWHRQPLGPSTFSQAVAVTFTD